LSGREAAGGEATAPARWCHGRNLAGCWFRPRFSTRSTQEGSWGHGEPNHGVAQRGGGVGDGARQQQRRLLPVSRGRGSPGRGNTCANRGKEAGESGEAHRGLELGKPAARKALDSGQRQNRWLRRRRGCQSSKRRLAGLGELQRTTAKGRAGLMAPNAGRKQESGGGKAYQRRREE
jgi:hypothetical protein